MVRSRCVGFALLAGVAPSALAQTAPLPGSSAQAAPSAATQGTNEVPDIIVTARRRDESIQQTPIAVTAVNAATIENRVATNLTDLQGIAPNVQLESGGAFGQTSFFSIRGIGFQDVESSFDPAVGTIIDGIFIGRNVGSLTDFFDIEQVEILRGPQGTLFGRNTIGGTINVRTARPTGETSLQGRVTVGNAGRFDIRASAQTAIVKDLLAIKISVLNERFNNFYRNTFDNSDARRSRTFAARGTVRFTPTPTLTFDLIGDISRDRSGSFGLVPASALPGQLTLSPGDRFTNLPAGFDPNTLIGPTRSSVFALAGLIGGLTPAQISRYPAHPYDNAFNAPNRAPIDSGGVVLDGTWKLPSVTVKSLTGWRKVDENIFQDFDATGLPIFETNRIQSQEQFSQELNANTDFGGSRFNLTAGLYFFTQRYNLTQYFTGLFQNPLTGAFGPTNIRALGPFPNGLLNNQTYQRSNSYAVYAEGTWNVTDKLALTVGGRGTFDRKTFQTILAPTAAGPVTTGPFGGGAVNCALSGPLATVGYVTCNGKYRTDQFTPRAIVKYQFTPDINAYASFSKGYKAGGFNGRASTGSSVGPFDPEKVDAYEIGLKTSFFERRVRLNLAAFRNDYSNLQVEVVRPSPGPTGQETVVQNAAQSRTQGIEAELTAVPARGVNLNASIGYLDSKYKNFRSPIIANLGPGGAPIQIGYEDLTIFRPRRAPEFSWNVGGQYDGEISDRFKGYVRLDYRHTSTLFTTVRNQNFGRRGPLGILDGSIGVGLANDSVRASLYAKNLTDERYVQSGLAIADSAVAYQGSVGAFSSYGSRREWGGELAFKFR